MSVEWPQTLECWFLTTNTKTKPRLYISSSQLQRGPN